MDASALPAAAAEVVSKIAALRKHALAWPFLRSAEAAAAGRGASVPPLTLHSRAGEPVYVLTRDDRVAVIFHVVVREPTDRAIARVVAQELTEAYRTVGGAPPASWSEREAPQELRGLDSVAPLDAASIGYVTFSLFASSYKLPAQRAAAAATLSLFRDYLEYHLKVRPLCARCGERDARQRIAVLPPPSRPHFLTHAGG